MSNENSSSELIEIGSLFLLANSLKKTVEFIEHDMINSIIRGDEEAYNENYEVIKNVLSELVDILN